MFISMTGFGKASGNFDNLKYDIEIKCVNSRFCEISLKCPKYLYSIENEIKERIKNVISRGKIFVSITKDDNYDNGKTFIFDDDKLVNLLSTLKSLRKKIGSKEKIKLEHILHFAETLTSIDDTNVRKEEQVFLYNLINSALEDTMIMKKKEGIFLQNDVIKRIDIIEKETDNISAETSEKINDIRNNYRSKIDALSIDKSIIDEKRLELEILVLAEKSDITEECVRLKSHLAFFRKTANENNQSGRKLNFLLQEINREINTIASKSMDAGISQKISLLKEEVEKIREQIQNIE